MVIVDVNATNLDIIQSFDNEELGKHGRPKNLFKAFKRVFIRIDATGLSAYEAMIIRKISSFCEIQHTKQTAEARLAVLGSVGVKPSEAVEHGIKALGESCPDLDWCVMPVGASCFDVSATFTGGALLNFFGYNLRGFFELTEEEQKEAQAGKLFDLGAIVERNILAAFHKMVYTEWYEQSTGDDIVTASWIKRHAHSRISDNDRFVISRFLDNIGMEISFCDVSPEELSGKLEKEKKTFGSSYGDKAFVEIECNTSMYFYLMLQIFGEKNLIIDWEDYGVVTSKRVMNDYRNVKDLVHVPISANDLSIISTLNKNVRDQFKEILDQEEAEKAVRAAREQNVKLPQTATKVESINNSSDVNMFVKQFFLPAATRIRYTMLVPLDKQLKNPILNIWKGPRYSTGSAEYKEFFSIWATVCNIAKTYFFNE